MTAENAARKSFYEIFMESEDLSFHKWHHYFDIYQQYFSKYLDTEMKFLEIGVQMGGSARLFRRILGEKCHIIGIDIDPRCLDFAIPGKIDVEIGDQTDRDFLNRVADKYGPFDVILDDGGHGLNQIWTSFDVLFDHLKTGGVYMIEDVAVHFWKSGRFGDDPQGRTIMDFVEMLFRLMNEDSSKEELFEYWHTPLEQRTEKHSSTGRSREIVSVGLHDSIIAVKKGTRGELLSEVRNPMKEFFP